MKKFTFLPVLLSGLVALTPLKVRAKPIGLGDLPEKNQTDSLPFLLSSQKHQAIPNIKGLNYEQARKKLIKAGWKPRLTTWKRGSENNGQDKYFASKGYFEMSFCSGTGLAYCSFLFVDSSGNQLQVETQGQDAYATVYKWSLSRETENSNSAETHTAGTKKVNFECLNLGKVTMTTYQSPSIGKPKPASISINGKKYQAIAELGADNFHWISLDQKITVFHSSHPSVTISEKSYDCVDLDNIVSVKCNQGIVKTKYATYKRITKTQWKDTTHNVILNNQYMAESTSDLQVIYQLRCRK